MFFRKKPKATGKASIEFQLRSDDAAAAVEERDLSFDDQARMAMTELFNDIRNYLKRYPKESFLHDRQSYARIILHLISEQLPLSSEFPLINKEQSFIDTLKNDVDRRFTSEVANKHVKGIVYLFCVLKNIIHADCHMKGIVFPTLFKALSQMIQPQQQEQWSRLTSALQSDEKLIRGGKKGIINFLDSIIREGFIASRSEESFDERFERIMGDVLREMNAYLDEHKEATVFHDRQFYARIIRYLISDPPKSLEETFGLTEEEYRYVARFKDAVSSITIKPIAPRSLQKTLWLFEVLKYIIENDSDIEGVVFPVLLNSLSQMIQIKRKRWNDFEEALRSRRFSKTGRIDLLKSIIREELLSPYASDMEYVAEVKRARFRKDTRVELSVMSGEGEAAAVAPEERKESFDERSDNVIRGLFIDIRRYLTRYPKESLLHDRQPYARIIFHLISKKFSGLFSDDFSLESEEKKFIHAIWQKIEGYSFIEGAPENLKTVLLLFEVFKDIVISYHDMKGDVFSAIFTALSQLIQREDLKSQWKNFKLFLMLDELSVMARDETIGLLHRIVYQEFIEPYLMPDARPRRNTW